MTSYLCVDVALRAYAPVISKSLAVLVQMGVVHVRVDLEHHTLHRGSMTRHVYSAVIDSVSMTLHNHFLISMRSHAPCGLTPAVSLLMVQAGGQDGEFEAQAGRQEHAVTAAFKTAPPSSTSSGRHPQRRRPRRRRRADVICR